MMASFRLFEFSDDTLVCNSRTRRSCSMTALLARPVDCQWHALGVCVRARVWPHRCVNCRPEPDLLVGNIVDPVVCQSSGQTDTSLLAHHSVSGFAFTSSSTVGS